MRTELDVHKYIRDLEAQLRLTLFGDGGAASPDAAVLLVRGALARSDKPEATALAEATHQLAAARPGDRDLAAAAAHADGLAERNAARLDLAAASYSGLQARAAAAEDAGLAWAEQGRGPDAELRLRQAYALYEQLGSAEDMARVRSRLRKEGIRLCHWNHADRPAFGWDSLTDTERRIVELVARGLSNREVAAQMFLSVHTIAFHLRHVFWKLDVSSRVQLARVAAERASGPVAGAVLIAGRELRRGGYARASPAGRRRLRCPAAATCRALRLVERRRSEPPRPIRCTEFAIMPPGRG